MKVSECEKRKCPYKERRTWQQYYTPSNYHPIGFCHAYAFCTKHKQRVSLVKKCNTQQRGDSSGISRE